MKKAIHGWIAIILTSTSVLFVGAVAGAPRSSLVPFLPQGLAPFAPFRWLASFFPFAGMGTSELSFWGFTAVIFLSSAFVFSIWAAWRRALSVSQVILFGIIFNVAFIAMPLIVSHDVYLYAIYGSILGAHDLNPYLTLPSQLSIDPIFAYISAEWRNLPPNYGPVFVQLLGVLSKLIPNSFELIFVFKLIAGLASILTMLIVAKLALHSSKSHAAFAVVATGWNPAILIHTVGGGHMDALIGLFVSIALALLLFGKESNRLNGKSFFQFGVTAILTFATLLKAVMILPLLLHLVALIRNRALENRRLKIFKHLALIAALGIVFTGRFSESLSFTRGLFEFSWQANTLAPSAIFKLIALNLGLQRATGLVIDVVFVMVIVVAFGLLALRLYRLKRRVPLETAAAWGWQLLILMLALPLLWPWYISWVAPLIWLLPKVPRIAALVLSVALPPFVTVAETSLAPYASHLSKGFGVTVGAPVFLGLLVWLILVLYQKSHEKSD